MLPLSFNQQLIEALLEWLWRSWVSLGVSGHGSRARADRVIDPEALLLASTVWARYDPRLFDEMLDWLCLHSSLINLQRLRNLHQSGLGDTAVLSAVAAVIQKHSQQPKWKSLIRPNAEDGALSPLFLSLEGENTAWGQAEPLFASQGFHRGKLELRQMSQPPAPTAAPNLWLKLRTLFGTSTRAEIVLQLLTTGPATAGEIARRSGFTARSILVTLREMALSGHLYEPPRPARSRPQRGQLAPARTRGPSLAYSMRPEEWSFLRTWDEPTGFPTLQPPGPLLLLCQQLLACLASEKSAASHETQSMQLRTAITPALQAIQRQGLSGEYGLPAELPGETLVTTLADRLPQTIADL
jgi:hypothetical protein